MAETRVENAQDDSGRNETIIEPARGNEVANYKKDNREFGFEQVCDIVIVAK